LREISYYVEFVVDFCFEVPIEIARIEKECTYVRLEGTGGNRGRAPFIPTWARKR